MNSLRTDDIIGAVPRIRHMPKNLYRPQPYYNNNSIEGYNSQQYLGRRSDERMRDYDANYNGGKWEQSYNENMYGNFPLSQYDPNPFIKQSPKNPIPNTSRTRYSQENEYNKARSISQMGNYYDNPHIQTSERYLMRQQNGRTDLDTRRMSLDQKNYGLRYEQNNGYRKGSGDGKESRSRYENNKNQVGLNNQYKILPKQALVINYDQLKSMNSDQKNNYVNINEPIRQQNPQKSIKQQKIDRQNTKESSNSKRQKSIFRGIGFNIITNSKYQYNVQTTNPYSSRLKQ